MTTDETVNYYEKQRQSLDEMTSKLKDFSKLPSVRSSILTDFELNSLLHGLILKVKANNNILEIVEKWLTFTADRLESLSSMVFSLLEQIESISGLDTDNIKEELEKIKRELKEEVKPAVELIKEAKKRQKKWMEENR